ncbi:MAG: type II secretion system protein [bacterium]|nr:type II secretion system protein [bacterium]
MKHGFTPTPNPRLASKSSLTIRRSRLSASVSVNRQPNKGLVWGFTLIELLVVMTIILVLFFLVLVNYRLGEKSFSLEESAAKLGQDFRRMEEMAMSAKEFHGKIPRGGYGVYLRAGDSLYTLFADCDQNYQYTAAGTPCEGGYSEKVEEVSLGERLEISSLSSGSVLNVVFTPPIPLVTISGGANEATATVAIKQVSGKHKTIRVNKAGLIEIY